MLSLQNKKVFVAGHNGMVGRAICRRLQEENCAIICAAKSDLDLRDQAVVNDWMAQQKPDVVFLAAARVGGIGANNAYPAEFLYDNLMIQNNVIHAAYMAGVEKLLFLGSSCIYPKEAPCPIAEDSLMTGPLEPTNEAYAVAKIAGLKMCAAYRKQYGCDFIAAMPCNLYGPFDKFDLENSHVIPALMMKFDAAKMQNAAKVELWGTGKPLREFLYVDDLADGLVTLIKNYTGEAHVNIGSSVEITIADLAQKITNITGYKGEVVFNSTQPDGTYRKVMDNSVMASLGWQVSTNLDDGLAASYQWYKDNVAGRYAA